MTPERFVEAVVSNGRDAAVADCVANFERPPGRKPAPRLIELSQWFNHLAERDRELVISALREVADATLFGVFCVIDGVRAIEPAGEKSQFRLLAVRDGVEDQIAPSETFLHDIRRDDL